MRILVAVHGFLTPSMTFVYNQVSALRQMGHEVRVVACERKNEHLFPFEEVYVLPEAALSLYLSKVKNRLGFPFSLHSTPLLRGLKQQLDDFKPDIVHVQFGVHLIRVFPALKQGGVPVLVTFHGVDASRYLLRPGYQKALKRILQLPFVFAITVSRDMKQRLVSYGIPGERVFVDYLGVDVSFFSRKGQQTVNSRPLRYLQVSNFVEKKGHSYTMEAFALFCNAHPELDAVLILAGDGPLLDEMKALAVALGLKSKVLFPGLVDKMQVRNWMEEADFFVHHSVTSRDGDMEGLPTVIMEALAMELPVLSTFHAGIPELIEDGVNGVLVKERDVEAMSAGFNKLITLKRDALRTRVVDDFNLEVNTRNLVTIYNKLLAHDGW